jgi:hypothetical protein
LNNLPSNIVLGRTAAEAASAEVISETPLGFRRGYKVLIRSRR